MASTLLEYAVRKEEIHRHLGGVCNKCRRADDLHVDHIDPKSKEFTIMPSWSLSWDKLLPELAKCQLLCKECHLEKSRSEGDLATGWTSKPYWNHGTVWGYSKYKCRCEDCKLAKSKKMKQDYTKNIGV